MGGRRGMGSKVKVGWSLATFLYLFGGGRRRGSGYLTHQFLFCRKFRFLVIMIDDDKLKRRYLVIIRVNVHTGYIIMSLEY